MPLRGLHLHVIHVLNAASVARFTRHTTFSQIGNPAHLSPKTTLINGVCPPQQHNYGY
jgi:hypothetical protein